MILYSKASVFFSRSIFYIYWVWQINQQWRCKKGYVGFLGFCSQGVWDIFDIFQMQSFLVYQQMKVKFWIIYFGKVEHEKKSQKSMGKGGCRWGNRKVICNYYFFNSWCVKHTAVLVLHIKGHNSYVQTYIILFVNWLRMMCCAMFFLFVERELLVMKWCFLQPHCATLLGCTRWNHATTLQTSVAKILY